jgi:serine/threonine protein kinase
VSPETHAMASLLGAVLEGGYRIERRIAEGGMGAVYAATHVRLDGPVAVKVMAPDPNANQEETRARFFQEARVMSKLRHPNIVQISDFNLTPTGEPFLVMELLEGEDLHSRLGRAGRLPFHGAVRVVKQVAAALMVAHDQGIVHRDLKPANIFLLKAAEEGYFVKLLDFGISKSRYDDSAPLTRTKAVLGTPNYMSPEQAHGRSKEVDGRADQWALACIAWECLTGEMLFDGETAMSILLKIVNEPPQPLLGKVPRLPPRVQDVIFRALAQDREARFPDVHAFAAEFESAMAAPAPKQTPLPPTVRLTPHQLSTQIAAPMWVRYRKWIVLSILAMGVLLGVYLLLPASPPVPPQPLPQPEPKRNAPTQFIVDENPMSAVPPAAPTKPAEPPAVKLPVSPRSVSLEGPEIAKRPPPAPVPEERHPSPKKPELHFKKKPAPKKPASPKPWEVNPP